MNNYSVFEFKEYQDFVRAILGKNERNKRDGSVKNLAEFLKCHSTYISQVIGRKAHFSNEQAILFCQYFDLEDEEIEFFMNLVNRDRAGNNESINYFNRIIKRQLDERSNLSKRFKANNHLSLEQSVRYYETWIPQAVHILSQIDGFNTPEAISKALRIDTRKISSVLKMLHEIGLIKLQGDNIEVLIDSIHLEKKSPLYMKFLSNWRFKSIEDMGQEKDSRAISYSSVVSLSEEAQGKIQNIILKQLEETREIILESKSETLCVYNIDFYSLIK